MSAITYGATVASKPAAKRKGFFAGFYQALLRSRMQQAHRELARYRHLMPDELERAALKVDWRTEDSLPFMR